jgi:ubiquinone/menaquinone biosynthesis C-methylase UbiE
MLNAPTDQAITDYFDRCAEKRLMTDFTDEERARLDAFLALWAIQSGERVLEPGCGSGRLTEALARAVGPQGEVHACDLSEKMLDLARARRLPKQARFVRQSVLELQRPDCWFDVVVCLNVFPHFAEPERTLRRFARALRPDGRLWVNHFQGRARLNRFHREAGPEVSRHALPGARDMKRLMNGAGFRVVHFIDSDERYELGAQRVRGGLD